MIIPYLFKSSLDVGSHFVDIVPDNELLFINKDNHLYTQLTIKNVTTRAPVAFFVRFTYKLNLVGFHICSFSNKYCA